MSKTKASTATEKEIRALIDGWAKATLAQDIEGIVSCYAPDVRAFDAILELQFKGRQAYRKHWETCFSYMKGEMIFEVHDLDIAARDDLAYCHYLARCGCTDEKGEQKAGWLRGTVCCRKTDGQWRIAHEHYSMPFDPESGKMLDLQPDHVARSSAA